MKIVRFYTLILLCIVAMVACDEKEKSTKWQDTTTTGAIPIAVDESFEPIIETEIDVFESINPQTEINPIYTNEKEALEMLFNDSVRLAIVTRKLTDAEKAEYEAKKRFPKEWHIATDAIALVVNKSNPDTLISVGDLKRILTGEVRKWTDLNPKSTLKGDINIVFDNTKSGNLRYIVDSICKGAKLSENVFAQKKNSEVIDYVEKSPHAIGLIGVNWVGNDSDTTRMSFNERVTVMAVSKFEYANEDNSYQPYQAYIATKDYPLTRDVYAILNDPRSGLSTGFTSFLCKQRGQMIILKSGLLPATQQIRVVQVTR